MGERKRAFRLHDSQSGSALTIRVTPRASHNEISEILDDGTIKVRLTASAPDKKINLALLSYLSGVLGIPENQMEIVAGDSGMDKLVTITGIEAERVQKLILNQLNLG